MFFQVLFNEKPDFTTKPVPANIIVLKNSDSVYEGAVKSISAPSPKVVVSILYSPQRVLLRKVSFSPQQFQNKTTQGKIDFAA